MANAEQKVPAVEPVRAPSESPDSRETFGQCLRRVRTQNGLGLDAVCASTGICRFMLERIEADLSGKPTVYMRQKIATGIGAHVLALENTQRILPPLHQRISLDIAPDVVKIGKLPTSHVVFEHGEVARMHAVLERAGKRVAHHRPRLAPRHQRQWCCGQQKHTYCVGRCSDIWVFVHPHHRLITPIGTRPTLEPRTRRFFLLHSLSDLYHTRSVDYRA